MLHAAATFAGLFILVMLLVGPLNGEAEVVTAAGVAIAATLLALRLGGLPTSLADALSGARGAFRGAMRVVGGAFKTIRAAAAADIALTPGLIHLGSGRMPAAERTRAALALGRAPGSVVVESDESGLLVHVMDENDADAASLERETLLRGART